MKTDTSIAKEESVCRGMSEDVGGVHNAMPSSSKAVSLVYTEHYTKTAYEKHSWCETTSGSNKPSVRLSDEMTDTVDMSADVYSSSDCSEGEPGYNDMTCGTDVPTMDITKEVEVCTVKSANGAMGTLMGPMDSDCTMLGR